MLIRLCVQGNFGFGEAYSDGLDDRVQFIEDDYRQVRGRFDAFVSVGMLEHVGIGNFAELGRLINRSLKLTGRVLIHTIGRNVPAPLDAWNDKYILPGAEPPSLSQMTQVFEAGRLSVLDVENLRLHYAKTLTEWRQRFESAAENIEHQFDARFVRMWRCICVPRSRRFSAAICSSFKSRFPTRRTTTCRGLAWTCIVRGRSTPGLNEAHHGLLRNLDRWWRPGRFRVRLGTSESRL